MKTSISSQSSLLLLFSLLFALFTFTSAQKGLPNLSSITQVAGASRTDSSSAAKTSSTSDKGKQNSKSTSADSATHTSTGAASLTSAGGLTGLPSLAGVGIPSLVIPNTANAPFMQKSNLPEGTVFICVGAALGFLGMSVLAWRGAVAWSLHRSVKRAAAVQYMTDKKVRYQSSGMYSTQNVSMENLTALNTSSYAAPRPGKTASRQFTPNASLFFSPTAGGAGMHNAATRTSSSTYLPAGFYASGASVPAAGSPVAHLGGGPPAAGYGRLSASHTRAPSPPESPRAYPADRAGDRGSSYSRMGSAGASRSSLSLGVAPQQRAPSAYLEDLFENHGNGPRERF